MGRVSYNRYKQHNVSKSRVPDINLGTSPLSHMDGTCTFRSGHRVSLSVHNRHTCRKFGIPENLPAQIFLGGWQLYFIPISSPR